MLDKKYNAVIKRDMQVTEKQIKQEKLEGRRQNILQAAVRVFKREGLSKTSMRTIALEAGCTTGAIYPLFSGKEEIYGALLEESLDRLYSHVASSSATEADAFSALEKAAKAFFGYYAERRFEVDLGLYLFGEERSKGLGRQKDQLLNASLLRTLNIFKACFVRLFEQAGLKEPEKQSVKERDALFALLMGALMLSHTGRAGSIGTDADTVLETYLATLRDKTKI